MEAINYENSSIRIADSGLAEDNYLCSSNNPLYPFSRDWYYSRSFSPIREFNKPITYIECTAPANSSARYRPAPPCSSSSSSVSSYVVIGHMFSSEVENNCKIRRTTWVSSSWPNINQTSFLDPQDIHKIVYGIELPFHYFYCLNCSGPATPFNYCLGVQRENYNFNCESTYNFCKHLFIIGYMSDKCGKK